MLQLAEKVGPHICMLKTHADIIDDFSLTEMAKLHVLAEKYQFIIFEDR